MSITEKRRQLVSFTDRYYGNVVRFVTRRDSGFDPEAPAGRTIGAARATVSSDWLEANLSGIADIRLFTESGAPLQALAEGSIDAVLGDGLGFWNWLQSPQGADFEFAGDGFRLDEGIGIAVRKDDDTLGICIEKLTASCSHLPIDFAVRRPGNPATSPRRCPSPQGQNVRRCIEVGVIRMAATH